MHYSPHIVQSQVHIARRLSSYAYQIYFSFEWRKVCQPAIRKQVHDDTSVGFAV